MEWMKGIWILIWFWHDYDQREVTKVKIIWWLRPLTLWCRAVRSPLFFFILTDSELQEPSEKLPDFPLVKDRQVERRANWNREIFCNFLPVTSIGLLQLSAPLRPPNGAAHTDADDGFPFPLTHSPKALQTHHLLAWSSVRNSWSCSCPSLRRFPRSLW